MKRALRHVHLFLKFGVTIEHNNTAETALFNLLDFIITLATFDLWASRYIRVRYRVARLYRSLSDYLRGWGDDLRLMVTAVKMTWQPVWVYG